MKSTIDLFRRCSVSNVDPLTVADESVKVVMSARVGELTVGVSDIDEVIRLSVISFIIVVTVEAIEDDSTVAPMSTVVAISLFDVGSSVNADVAWEVCWAIVSASASALVVAAVVTAIVFVVVTITVVVGTIVVVCVTSVVVCAVVSVTSVVGVSVVVTGMLVVLSAFGAKDGLAVVASVGDRMSTSIVSALGLGVTSSLITAAVVSAGLLSFGSAVVLVAESEIVGVVGCVGAPSPVPLEGASVGN